MLIIKMASVKSVTRLLSDFNRKIFKFIQSSTANNRKPQVSMMLDTRLKVKGGRKGFKLFFNHFYTNCGCSPYTSFVSSYYFHSN